MHIRTIEAMKKMAGIKGDFRITGFHAYKGMSILFIAECDDEEFKKKIKENRLTEAERNFIISTASEYFDDKIKVSDDLFEYGVTELLIEHFENGFNIPDGLLNVEFLQTILQKKQKSDEKVFSKNKFRLLPLSEKNKILTDPMEWFYTMWGEDYLRKEFDINNLVSFQEDLYNIGDTEIVRANRILNRIVKAIKK